MVRGSNLAEIGLKFFKIYFYGFYKKLQFNMYHLISEFSSPSQKIILIELIRGRSACRARNFAFQNLEIPFKASTNVIKIYILKGSSSIFPFSVRRVIPKFCNLRNSPRINNFTFNLF